METYIGLALAVTMIQLLGAWLRYLPFKAELSAATAQRLWRCFALLAVLQTAAYIAFFTAKGLNVITYKLIMYTGFLLYFAASVYLISQRWLQHLFVISMQLMWALFIHAVGNTLAAELPLPISGEQQYLAVHTVFYLLIFALTLPLARKFFSNLLPPSYLFAKKMTGYYMALLPLGLGLSHLMLLADNRIVYSWNDHLSRLLLFFWVFLFYRFMAILVRRTEEQDRKENSYLMMSQRMKALEDYTRLTWERQEEIMRIRHDLRHYNRLLLSLIESGETKKAADLIIAEEGEILATSLPTYCQNPIINAALGVYFQRAEEQGIPVTHSVKLPPKLVMEERDLAILLSNVLENAIIANMRQPADRRGLNVSLQYHGPQYILSVENRCDTLLILGKDGLPVTEKKGHGLGMASLKDFCRKYGAETDFRQQDGWVRVLMYWAEEEK
jgi:hypothetical protein